MLRKLTGEARFRNIRIRPLGRGNPTSRKIRQTPATAEEEELSQRPKGRQWVNTNKATFEWTADGRFLHNGVEREWKVLDGQRVQVIFGPNHKDTREFNADFTRFKQLIRGGPDFFDGRQVARNH